jgi:hypothetical protein
MQWSYVAAAMMAMVVWAKGIVGSGNNHNGLDE